MKFSPSVDKLVDTLQILPGVGPKSAQRMAFHLLERARGGGLNLSKALESAMKDVGHCKSCRTFTEFDECEICASPKRQASGLLCVVESPADVMAIEQTGHYSGCYFVLMGHLSPLDGIGPMDIGLDTFEKKITETEIKEVILATNPTVEGEATAHYIADLCRTHQVPVSRIAHGVPVGGELEMVDGTTLSHAFSGRKTLD